MESFSARILTIALVPHSQWGHSIADSQEQQRKTAVYVCGWRDWGVKGYPSLGKKWWKPYLLLQVRGHYVGYNGLLGIQKLVWETQNKRETKENSVLSTTELDPHAGE